MTTHRVVSATQRVVGVRLVADVARGIDDKIGVTTEGGEIVIRKGRTVESYATAEEAIAGLQASWAPSSP